MIDVQGQKYPSSDGLTEADASIYKAYTEWLQQSPVGIPFDEYMHTKFYSFFDYTGAQNIFNLPSIQTETGEKVQNRFINM